MKQNEYRANQFFDAHRKEETARRYWRKHDTEQAARAAAINKHIGSLASAKLEPIN